MSSSSSSSSSPFAHSPREADADDDAFVDDGGYAYSTDDYSIYDYYDDVAIQSGNFDTTCALPTDCYGASCDDWSDYTCGTLEGMYGCDCAGCRCATLIDVSGTGGGYGAYGYAGYDSGDDGGGSGADDDCRDADIGVYDSYGDGCTGSVGAPRASGRRLLPRPVVPHTMRSGAAVATTRVSRDSP